MNTPRLLPLLCSATLFLTGYAHGQMTSNAGAAAPSSIGDDIFGPALAPPQHHEHALTAQEKELLAKYDKNGDGRLDSTELDAAHGAAQQQKAGREAMARKMYDQLLEKFDTAKEGKLNADEQKQAVEYLKTSRPRMYAALVKQFDRNGDGQLNDAETAAAFQYLGYLPAGLGKFAPKDDAATPGMNGAAGDGLMGGGDMMMSMAGGDTQAAAMKRPAAKSSGLAADPRVAQLARVYARLLKGFDHEGKGSLTPAEQTEAVDYLETNNPGMYARIVKGFDENGDGKLDAVETADMFAILAGVRDVAGESE